MEVPTKNGGVDLRKLGFSLNLLGFNLEKSWCYIVNTIPDVFNKKRFHLPCCNSTLLSHMAVYSWCASSKKHGDFLVRFVQIRCEKMIRTKSKTSWNFTWIWHHEKIMVYHHVPQQYVAISGLKKKCIFRPEKYIPMWLAIADSIDSSCKSQKISHYIPKNVVILLHPHNIAPKKM